MRGRAGRRRRVLAVASAVSLATVLLASLSDDVTSASLSATTSSGPNLLGAQTLDRYVPAAVQATRTGATGCLVTWTPAPGTAPDGLVYDVYDGATLLGTGVDGAAAALVVGPQRVTPRVHARVGTWVSATGATVTGGGCVPVPGAPTGVSVAVGDGSLTVSWSPADGNGEPVTGYAVTVTPDGGGTAAGCVPAPPSGTSCTVTGLTNWTRYAATVTASNADGAGPASEPVSGRPVSARVLDTLDVPPVAAFGLRRLRAAHLGPAVQVRRASDGALSDVGFAADGGLDTTALLAFCPATCTVRTWYDQSGAGAPGDGDLVRTDPSAQPLLVAGGAVETERGRPVLRLSGAQGLASAQTSVGGTALTVNVVGQATGTSAAAGRLVSYTGTGQAADDDNAASVALRRAGAGQVGLERAGVTAQVGAPDAFPHPLTAVLDGAQATTYLGTRAGTPVTSSGAFAATGVLSVGATSDPGDGATTLTGSLGEVVLFADVVGGADRALLVASQADAHALPPAVPTGLVVDGGDGTATASWTASQDLGTGAVLGYTVTAVPQDSTRATVTCTAAPPATGCTLTGLTNGVTYDVTVAATSATGAGPATGAVAVRPFPTGVSGLAPGRFQTCALDSDGGWWCWGNVPQRTVSVVPVRVDAGTYREAGSFGSSVQCAIRADGTLWCFGTGTAGQLGQGTTASSATPVQVTASTTWRQLGSGDSHVCATRTDDSLWCWGQNTYGQVGDGTTTHRTAPYQVSASASWLRVWSSDRGSCALRQDLSAWCWGNNTYGQVGTGTAGGNITAPAQVGTAQDWTQLAPGRNHTCGIRVGGDLWCWGQNTLGQLGDGTTTDRTAPTPVAAGSAWLQVVSLLDTTCALRADRTVWCWGNSAGGRTGQPGQILTAATTSPLQVGTDASWQTLVAGQLHACGVRTDRTVWCWGDDRYGQSGAEPAALATPRQVSAGPWAAVSAGGTTTCAVGTDTSLWCWGANNSARGSFPDPAVSDAPLPRQLEASGWAAVGMGSEHGCGVRTDGTLQCWGTNLYGEAGTGTTTSALTTTQVGVGTTWADVRGGAFHTCATRTDGGLWCWGNNGSGRLGDGTTTNRTSPVQIGSAAWAGVAAGSDHTCGIRTDATLWCWGSNASGQLGDGTTTNRTSPTQVGTGTWLAVSTGTQVTCAVRSDATLWCWGLNGSGQLGDGTTTTRTTPVQVGSGTTWQGVLATTATICARRTDGSLWCWGANSYGQAGQGAFTASAPVAQVLTGVGDLTALSAGQASLVEVLDQDGSLWGWGRNDRFGVGAGGHQDAPVQVSGAATWAY